MDILYIGLIIAFAALTLGLARVAGRLRDAGSHK